MALGTNNAAELTQAQVQAMLVEPLEQQSVFLSAGPTIFETDGNAVRIPKAPSSEYGQLEWVAENEQIPEQDYDFSELKLLPDTMQSVKTITRFSNELARQSIVNLEGAIRARMVADQAAKIDERFLSDKGDGVETPLGIFAYEDTGSIEASELTPDTLLDAYGVALSANVDPDNLTLFIRPDDYMAMRKLKDENGRYIVEPDVSTGRIVVPLLNAEAKISGRIPEGHAALVDMAQIAVARDVDPAVKLLTERYADYDQQALRVVTRLDAGAMNPEAIVTIEVE